MILVCFQSKPFNIRVIQVYAPPTNAEEAEVEWFYDDLQKKGTFHHKELEYQSRKWQIPGVTGKFGHGVQNEAKQRLSGFYQENTLFIANTCFQQHKRWLDIWTSPDGQYQNQVDYILCCQGWVNSIQCAKTRPGADCGSNHELLIAKFRLKWKKVGKTTRPFRYNLNWISYDYTVELTNRFKGLDLIECLKNYGWRFVTFYRRQWPKPSRS